MPSHTLGAVCKWMKSLKNPFDCVLSSSCSMQPHTPGNRVILVCAKFYYLIMNGMFLIWGSCILFVEFEWVTKCSTTAAVFLWGLLDWRSLRAAVPCDPTAPRAGWGRCVPQDEGGGGLVSGVPAWLWSALGNVPCRGEPIAHTGKWIWFGYTLSSLNYMLTLHRFLAGMVIFVCVISVFNVLSANLDRGWVQRNWKQAISHVEL